jgi:hypothetical protein
METPCYPLGALISHSLMNNKQAYHQSSLLKTMPSACLWEALGLFSTATQAPQNQIKTLLPEDQSLLKQK